MQQDSDDNLFAVVRTNVGFVIRGPALSVQEFLKFLRTYLQEHPDLYLVHRIISGEKIWIHEGGSKDGPEEVGGR